MPRPKTKVCKKCGEDKSLEEYYNTKKNKQGKYSRCMSCTREDANSYARSDEGKDKRLVRQIEKYGIPFNDYEELLASQNGVCAICFQSEPIFSRLVVDHCHNSNKGRGLLCSNCNKALGLMKDSQEQLLSAVRYLKNA